MPSPSDRLKEPTRAGLNAVAAPRGRNLQAGTVMFRQRIMTIKPTAVLILIFVSAILTACGSPAGSNSNANTNANVNAGVKVDPANMPEGLSTKPIEPGPEPTPGIPAGNTTVTVPPNVSPAPGIPSAEELKKQRKPGATPTPGIPSEEEIRRQMNRPAGNANAQQPGGAN